MDRRKYKHIITNLDDMVHKVFMNSAFSWENVFSGLCYEEQIESVYIIASWTLTFIFVIVVLNKLK